MKFKTDTFSNVRPFDIFSWNEINQLFLDNQRKILETGEWEYENVDFNKFTILEERKDKIRFKNSRFWKKCKYGTIINAKCDISGKTLDKKCIEKGKFIFISIPKDFVNQNVNSCLHNVDLSIIRKFINEVENTPEKWEGENWKWIRNSYNVEYPQVTDKTNKKELVYKWSADFSIEWYMSLKEDGILNPLIYLQNKWNDQWTFDGRGTHRVYLTALAGYDVPMFLRIDDDINPVYHNSRTGAIDKIEIDREQKNIKFYFNGRKDFEEVRY